MKTVKKLISCVIAMCVIFSLAACGETEITADEVLNVALISDSTDLKTDTLTDKYSNTELRITCTGSDELSLSRADIVCMDIKAYFQADDAEKAELARLLRDKYSSGEKLVFLSGGEKVTSSDIGDIMGFSMLCDVSLEPVDKSTAVQNTSVADTSGAEKIIGYSLQRCKSGFNALNCFFDGTNGALSDTELIASMLGASSDTAMELNESDILPYKDYSGITTGNEKYAIPVIYEIYDAARVQQTLFFSKLAQAEDHATCEMRTLMNVETDMQSGYNTVVLDVENKADYDGQYTGGYMPMPTDGDTRNLIANDFSNRYLMRGVSVIPHYDAEKRSCEWHFDFNNAVYSENKNFSYASLVIDKYSEALSGTSTYRLTLSKKLFGLAAGKKEYARNSYVVINQTNMLDDIAD